MWSGGCATSLMVLDSSACLDVVLDSRARSVLRGRLLDAEPGIRRYRFHDREGADWLAAWSLGPARRLALDRAVVEAYSRDGEALAVPRPEAIELGSSPVYLRLG